MLKKYFRFLCLLVPVISVLTFFSCTRPPDTTIRVMNYNIAAGFGDLDAIVGVIRRYDPDVVALQEVDVHWSARSFHVNQAEYLARELGMHVFFAEIYTLEPDRVPEDGTTWPDRQYGLAFLSKKPFLHTENHPLTRHSTQRQVPGIRKLPGFPEVVVPVGDQPVHFFNTHLDYRPDPAVRSVQTGEMLDIMKGTEGPIVLAGDLNARPGAPEIAPIFDFLRDAWRDQDDPGYTFPAEAPDRRIDYILHSEHFKVVHVEVVDDQSSDHLAIVADLLLTPQEQPGGSAKSRDGTSSSWNKGFFSASARIPIGSGLFSTASARPFSVSVTDNKPAPARPHTEELRAVKITNVDSQVLFSDEAISEAMDYLASIGINAILPVVQNGGYTQFPSEVMDRYFDIPLDPRLGGRDPLEAIIREAHRVGIEVYPWFEYGFAVHYSGDNPATGGFIGQRYPDWLSRHRNGDICKKNGFEWMSGINPDVQQFMLELVMEVVRIYDVDGIEFSDRMPALPVECGYDQATADIYRTEHGGMSPPPVEKNTFWMRWRADKLNDFYQMVRDSVKSYDRDLFVASSPNIYPWGYAEYLQDPVGWARDGIIDHLIPQLYRYQIDEYDFELRKTLRDLPADRRDIYFAGILMNLGHYIIAPDLLGAKIDSNRAAGVAGEAYFFYEGLRKYENELGDFLAENYYGEPALVPGRNGEQRRFPALKLATDLGMLDGWRETDTLTPAGPLFVRDDLSDPGEHAHRTEIAFSFEGHPPGWYDVYVWTLADEAYADSVYLVSHRPEASLEEGAVTVNDGTRSGWYRIGTFRVGSEEGSDISDSPSAAVLFHIDHARTEAEITEKPVALAGAMAVVNRKKERVGEEVPSSSPFVEMRPDRVPHDAILLSNYPNPFNSTTIIELSVPETGRVRLAVYDLAGRHVQTLHDGYIPSGSHRFSWNAASLASGTYVVRLQAEEQIRYHKVTLIK